MENCPKITCLPFINGVDVVLRKFFSLLDFNFFTVSNDFFHFLRLMLCHSLQSLLMDLPIRDFTLEIRTGLGLETNYFE